MHELESPAPGDETERDFQTTRPVDAHAGGIGAKPTLQMAHDSICIAFVTRQAIGLPEMHQPLMTVELPDDFGVAHAVVVEGIQPTPMRERWPASGDRI